MRERQLRKEAITDETATTSEPGTVPPVDRQLPVLLIDQGKIAWISDRFGSLFDLPTGEIPADRQEEIKDTLLERLASPAAFEEEYLAGSADTSSVHRKYDPDGEEMRSLLTWTRELTAGQYAGSTLVYCVDRNRIAGKDQRAETDLELARWAERAVGMGVWELDTETNTLTWTEGANHLFELPGQYAPTADDLSAYFFREDRDTAKELIEQCRATGRAFDATLRIVTAGGTQRWVRFTGTTLEPGESPGESSGDSPVIRGTFQDVTERREYERSWAAFDHRLRAAYREHVARIENEAGDLTTDVEGAGEAGVGTAETTGRYIRRHALELEKLLRTAGQIDDCRGGDEDLRECSVTELVTSVASAYGRLEPAASIDMLGDDVTAYCNPIQVETIVAVLLETTLDRAEGAPKLSLGVSDREDDFEMTLTATCGNWPDGFEGLLMSERADPTGDSAPSIRDDPRQDIAGFDDADVASAGIALRAVHTLIEDLSGEVDLEVHDPYGFVLTVRLPMEFDPSYSLFDEGDNEYRI